MVIDLNGYRALFAFSVAWIAPPLAALYVGTWRRALVYLLLMLVCGALAHVVVLLGQWSGLAMFFPATVLVKLIAAFDCLLRALHRESEVSRKAWMPMPLVVVLLPGYLYLPSWEQEWLVGVYGVEQPAMIPTLWPGDQVVVKRLPRLLASHRSAGDDAVIYRGDVVVFQPRVGGGKVMFRRVIGVPGDHVRFDGSRLYVNGRLLVRQRLPYYWRDTLQAEGLYWLNIPVYAESLGSFSYVVALSKQSGGVTGEWIVGPGDYFLVGDNRDFSTDSRHWGVVAGNRIVGVAKWVWFSIQRTPRDRSVRWRRVFAAVR